MSKELLYKNCPLCNHSHIVKALLLKDHSVSLEDFEIWECKKCQFRFTQNAPDITNIGRYYHSSSYISHSDTSKGIINKLYHFARNVTLQLKKKLVKKFSRIDYGKLLDVGAGTGAFVRFMEDAGWEITGLEPDDIARKNALTINKVQLKPVEEINSLPNECFDVITLWHVLEHVHELHGYMTKFKNLLKKSGVLIVALPNHTSYDAHVYAGAWAAYDVPRHLWHFSPKSFEILARHHGFEIISHKPMWFDSLYISLLSEKYLTGKVNPIKAFITGSFSNLKALFNIKKCSSVIYVLKVKGEL